MTLESKDGLFDEDEYFQEMEVQIDYFFNCIDLTNKQLEAGGKAESGARYTATVRVFGLLSAALNHAAVLSKFLWNERNKKTLRRSEQLRNMLHIKDGDLTTLKNRNIRNSFEHVDERIDCILEGTLWSGQDRVDFSIGIWNHDVHVPSANVRRFFDVAEQCLILYGDRISMVDLVSDVKDLLFRVKSRSLLGRGWHRSFHLDPFLYEFLDKECRLGILLIHAEQYLDPDGLEKFKSLLFNIYYDYMSGKPHSAISASNAQKIKEILGPLQSNKEFLFDPDRLNYKLFAFQIQVDAFARTGKGVWVDPPMRGVAQHRTEYRTLGFVIKGVERSFPVLSDDERRRIRSVDFDKKFPPTI